MIIIDKLSRENREIRLEMEYSSAVRYDCLQQLAQVLSCSPLPIPEKVTVTVTVTVTILKRNKLREFAVLLE